MNIYFWLTYGLVDAINTYLKINIRVLWGWGFFNLKCIFIEFVIPNMSQIFWKSEIFKLALKLFFVYKNTFEFLGACCEILKDNFLVQKLVLDTIELNHSGIQKTLFYTSMHKEEIQKIKRLWLTSVPIDTPESWITTK